jgi:hypothetical protein
MQGGKNWILPKEINVNRSSETLICLKSEKKLLTLYGADRGNVAMDSALN